MTDMTDHRCISHAAVRGHEKRCALYSGHPGPHTWLEDSNVLDGPPIRAEWNGGQPVREVQGEARGTVGYVTVIDNGDVVVTVDRDADDMPKLDEPVVIVPLTRKPKPAPAAMSDDDMANCMVVTGAVFGALMGMPAAVSAEPDRNTLLLRLNVHGQPVPAHRHPRTRGVLMPGPAMTLQQRIKAAIQQDQWDNGTSPETAAAILRGEAAELEQAANIRRRTNQ